MVTPVSLAQTLLEARRSGRHATLPPGAERLTLDDAFAVQDLVLSGQSERAAGWKVSLSQPIDACAPFAAADILASGKDFTPLLPDDVVIELEIVVLLDRELPARPAPYKSAEVVAAIGQAVAGIEIVQGRFGPDLATSRQVSVADALTGAAMVLSTDGQAWSDLQLDALSYELRLGEDLARSNSVGLPGRDHIEEALTWLANHARTRGGLPRGTPVLTGARAKLGPVPASGTVFGSITGLGEVFVRFDTPSNLAALPAHKEQ